MGHAYKKLLCQCGCKSQYQWDLQLQHFTPIPKINFQGFGEFGRGGGELLIIEASLHDLSKQILKLVKVAGKLPLVAEYKVDDEMSLKG